MDWKDPTKPPVDPNGEEWVWHRKPPQGGDKGGYVNPSNPDQSAHPDLAHPEPVGPHWDYTDRNKDNPGWRVDLCSLKTRSSTSIDTAFSLSLSASKQYAVIRSAGISC
ncbi:hypothetical protein GTP91_24615 [Rugamonas sp. FT82W]|uniref:Uncharacterized protein n=1 Tax=Duganella vulcania TaxID=2692166 RepID=A0A845GA65_9BURK|nr:hypothetical protein [Duganella vulcania]